MNFNQLATWRKDYMTKNFNFN